MSKQDKQEKTLIGETVYALNLKYSNGTRLRLNPEEYSDFGNGFVPNDDPILVLDEKTNFLLVENMKKHQG